ncbi:MAG TPA: hypothetical protein VL426_03630 [Candidatus Binatia bacterium]|nr:hypothetical protein [Candidatus Binatia bacterium]
MRFELTIKDPAEAPGAIAALRKHGITAANVTDTAREIDPVAISRLLLKEEPELDLMVHLAAKHSASGTDAASRNAFSRRLADCADANIKKALVVSGQPKEEFDAVAALEVLDAEGFAIEAYCVYNPFLAGEELERENERIERKLRNGSVRGVCFQIGMDLTAIAAGASHLRSLRFDVELLASVPVPTEAMIARLKEKPLFGVALPETYFVSAQEAERMTRETLAALDAHDIEPLFFCARFDDATIEKAMALTGK